MRTELLLERARQRKNFYRHNFLMVVFLLFFLNIINISLVAVIGYVLIQRKVPDYYSSSNAGTLTPLKPNTLEGRE